MPFRACPTEQRDRREQEERQSAVLRSPIGRVERRETERLKMGC
jgi:hypothetical protein